MFLSFEFDRFAVHQKTMFDNASPCVAGRQLDKMLLHRVLRFHRDRNELGTLLVLFKTVVRLGNRPDIPSDHRWKSQVFVPTKSGTVSCAAVPQFHGIFAVFLD